MLKVQIIAHGPFNGRTGKLEGCFVEAYRIIFDEPRGAVKDACFDYGEFAIIGTGRYVQATRLQRGQMFIHKNVLYTVDHMSGDRVLIREIARHDLNNTWMCSVSPTIESMNKKEIVRTDL